MKRAYLKKWKCIKILNSAPYPIKGNYSKGLNHKDGYKLITHTSLIQIFFYNNY
jgi:hypothetical protein